MALAQLPGIYENATKAEFGGTGVDPQAGTTHETRTEQIGSVMMSVALWRTSRCITYSNPRVPAPVATGVFGICRPFAQALYASPVFSAFHSFGYVLCSRWSISILSRIFKFLSLGATRPPPMGGNSSGL